MEAIASAFVGLPEAIFLGILLGGLYASIGVGLSMVFGVMKIVNLAHGDLMIVGSYLAFALLFNFGVDPLLSLIAVAPVLFVIGFAIQKSLINRVMRLGVEPALLIAFAISIVIQNLLLLTFTPDARGLTTSYSVSSYNIPGLFAVPVIYLIDFIAALAVIVVLYQFLRRTYMGKAIRAASEDARAAELMGINTSTIYAYTFGIAMLFAAVAGALVGMTFIFYPYTGAMYLIIAFGVVIIGGLGSMRGTFIGGIILGLAQLLGAHYFGPGYQLFIGYIILIIVLAVRPQGILGARG